MKSPLDAWLANQKKATRPAPKTTKTAITASVKRIPTNIVDRYRAMEAQLAHVTTEAEEDVLHQRLYKMYQAMTPVERERARA